MSNARKLATHQWRYVWSRAQQKTLTNNQAGVALHLH
jgi:hypothetical protein